MAKAITFDDEIKSIQKYLESTENEDAKRPLLFPLLKKIYKDKFTSESAAGTYGADGYVEGQLIVEAKTNYSQWLDGFYQALHYKQKHGLSFNTIMVIAHNFCGIWKVKDLPDFPIILANTSDVNVAPSAIGKLNASKTQTINKLAIKEVAQFWLEPKDLKGELFKDAKSLIAETYAIKDMLVNIESSRIPITIHNFISKIEEMKFYFNEPIDAIHAFYSIIPYWDETSKASLQGESEKFLVHGYNGIKTSEVIEVSANKKHDFVKFVNKYYIHTNNGSGLTIDFYFSRFDEVLAVLDPEYVKQHGIFFTDDNLSKFALWFAKNEVTETIHDNYVVFDPAGGSGNLISSYKGKIKQKIISELQPDLLKIIEKRMKADKWHVGIDITIVPKTITNEGLNFLDTSGEAYYNELEKAVLQNTQKGIERPLAFLLNPPYKNTDEKTSARTEKDAEYDIHPDILALTGADAGKERYLAFLGQIMNICKAQTAKLPNAKPLVMIFTPTSWLIPRPTYKQFRATWDQNFKYLNGFLTTSNEFFKLKGKWPLAFTIWEYDPQPERENKVKVLDLTNIKKQSLAFNWNDTDEVLKPTVENFVEQFGFVNLDNSKGSINDYLPLIKINNKEIRQPRYNMYRNLRTDDVGKFSGFPYNDKRHEKFVTPYGFNDGAFVGFMDDNTPVRLRQEPSNRITNSSESVWFLIQKEFKNILSFVVQNGPPNQKGYCANDKYSSEILLTLYAIATVLVGKYPTWVNQHDLWQPNILEDLKTDWYALCYAFGLAENRCVVTKFEKDNPVAGAPEVWVDNPMSPNNPDSFYCTTLQAEIKKSKSSASELAFKIEEFYEYWNLNFTKGQIVENVGLRDEAYFKYFDYPDFVTKNSGLVQIKKYAEVNECSDLLEKIAFIQALTKKVKNEIYEMLVNDFEYFN